MAQRRNGKGLRRRFWEKFNNPPNWVALLMYATTLIVCPLALAAFIMDYGHSVFAIVAYCICALIFLYTMIVAVNAVIRLRRKLLTVADKYEFTRRLHKSYAFRTIVLGACALLFNVGFTVFLCVMAVRTRSAWYGALALYNVLLVATWGGLLLQNRKDEKRYKYDPTKLQREKVGTYRYCGIMIIALTVALTASVVQMVVDGAGFRLPHWAIYPFAAFALYRVAKAAYNVVKSTKYDDLVVRAARNIGLATALVSVLTLQTAIFAAFPPSFDPSWLNAVAGIVVCCALIALGTFMIVFSGKVKKRLTVWETEKMQADEAAKGYNRDGYGEEYGTDVFKRAISPSETYDRLPEKSETQDVNENKSN